MDVFSFNPITGTLTPVTSFGYGLVIGNIFGVEQMALDATETRLFIAASDSRELKAFTTGGAFLGLVPGVEPFGGVAICQRT